MRPTILPILSEGGWLVWHLAQTAGVVLQGLPVHFFSSGELGNDEDDRSLQTFSNASPTSSICSTKSVTI